MDPYMKEVRKTMKKDKEHFNLLGYVADAQYGMPTRCPCGGSIVDEVAAHEDSDKLPGKIYFTYKNYQDGGLHFRQPWVIGVEEELVKLNMLGDEAEKLSWQVHDLLRADIHKLREEVEQLKMRVAELEMVL